MTPSFKEGLYVSCVFFFYSGEMGSGDTSTLDEHYWQEAGSSEFNSQNAGYSVSGTDECPQFNDAQNFRTFLEPLPLVMPSLTGAISSYSFVQPADGTIWTGPNATETGRGVTVECIQAGEAFSFGPSSSSSQELRDLNDDIVSFYFYYT